MRFKNVIVYIFKPNHDKLMTPERLFGAANPQYLVQNQTDRSNADGAFGNIERREMSASVMKIQKIHHIAIKGAVNHVANRATQNADQSEAKEFLAGVRHEHPDDKNRCCDTNSFPDQR